MLNKQVLVLRSKYICWYNGSIKFNIKTVSHESILSYVCTFLYDRMRTGGFWVFEFLTMVDDIAVSASPNWDPVSFPRQWPVFFEGGRVLSW
jgi:hypothetical protein